ncbi:MAG: hypothetical protein JW934_19740 [Anaerolineae bacterium]|nr:hypothetical protein [Anaerolineae bacterium]
MVEKTREQWSIHEAGRAIVACALGRPFEQASILPDLSGINAVSFEPEDGSAQQLKQAILVGLAGAAAETMHTTHGPLAIEMLTEDYGIVVSYVDALFEQSQGQELPGARDLLVLSLWEQVLKLLNTHWGSVALLSDLLLDLGTVSWIEVNELYEHTTRWHARS